MPISWSFAISFCLLSTGPLLCWSTAAISSTLSSPEASSSSSSSSNQNAKPQHVYPCVQKQPSTEHLNNFLRYMYSEDFLSRMSTSECFYVQSGSLQMEGNGVVTLRITFKQVNHSFARTEDPICSVSVYRNDSSGFFNRWTRGQFMVISSVSVIVGSFFIVAAAMRFKNYIKRKKERKEKRLKAQSNPRGHRRRNQSIRILQYNSNKLLSTCSMGRATDMIGGLSQQEKGKKSVTPDGELENGNIPQSGTTVTFVGDQPPAATNSSLKWSVLKGDLGRYGHKGSPRGESPSNGLYGSKKKLNRQNSLTEEIDSILHKHFGSRPRPPTTFNSVVNAATALQRSSSSNNLPSVFSKASMNTSRQHNLFLRSNTLTGLNNGPGGLSPMKSAVLQRLNQTAGGGNHLRPNPGSRWNRDISHLSASFRDSSKPTSGNSSARLNLNHSAATGQLSHELKSSLQSTGIGGGSGANSARNGTSIKHVSPPFSRDNGTNVGMSLGLASSESALSQLLPDHGSPSKGLAAPSADPQSNKSPAIASGVPKMSARTAHHSSNNMVTDV